MKKINEKNWKELKVGDLFVIKHWNDFWLSKTMTFPKMIRGEYLIAFDVMHLPFKIKKGKCIYTKENEPVDFEKEYPIYILEREGAPHGWTEFILNDKEEERYGKMYLAYLLKKRKV